MAFTITRSGSREAELAAFGLALAGFEAGPEGEDVVVPAGEEAAEETGEGDDDAAALDALNGAPPPTYHR